MAEIRRVTEIMSTVDRFATHQVENQPVPPGPYNAFASDPALREGILREGAGWAVDHLHRYGGLVGGELVEQGRLANENRPKLRSFDGYGRRIDEVEFHPAYHRLMAEAMRFGMNGLAWRNANRPGAHVARAAVMYLGSQADAGIGCPMSMTHAAIPALRRNPRLAELWVPKLISTDYDPRPIPMDQKTGCTIGMGMTEKQGGSDVRSNTTTASRRADGSYELVGHKYFFSAPMCDAHLVLARAEGGISCFLVPRLRADGTRNAVEVQRLKDKLGDWSNASSEVEFLGAEGELVGEEGRGISTIIDMVALTRLDCIIGSAAGMRQAVVHAVHHAGQRRAFGRLLIDQPLMRNVLADLALESEAAITLALRLARAFDNAGQDRSEAAFARVATAIGKYWVCKRTPAHVNEAQECLGGIGYVEDTVMPRLYRQAPLNSIWEGSGNVQCLDVLRALSREPDCREALFAELVAARGLDANFDRELTALASDFEDTHDLEYRSRHLVERAARLLQAAILLRGTDGVIAGEFCRSRIGGAHGITFGTLAPGAPVDRLIERARIGA